MRRDFEQQGVLFRAYWEAFSRVFDPELALTHSRWSIKKCGNKRCEINLQYEKSKYPAVVKLYREKGGWKVGLVESFWTRKRLLH